MTLPEQAALCYNNFCDPNASRSIRHTWIFEHLIHQNLIKSRTTVYDPNDADLFFVPVYFGAYNSNNGVYAKKAQMSNIVQELVRCGPWLIRSGGVDHVYTQILMQHDKGVLEVQKNIPSMITIGDILYDYAKHNPREAWRLTQVPYSSNFDDYFNDTRRVIPLFFIGQQTMEGRSDQKTRKMRKELGVEIVKMRNAVAIFTKDKKNEKSAAAFDINSFMKKSQFCPVPSGETPSSKRLYDAFKSRCIPLILSDDMRFPFENVFCEYSGTVVQIPMNEAESVPIITGMIPEREKKEIRANINEMSTLFSIDLDADSHNGDLIWAWKWSQFFKAATIATSKRREFVKNRFYTPIYKPNSTSI